MLNRGPHLCVLIVLDVRQIQLTGEGKIKKPIPVPWAKDHMLGLLQL